MENIIKQIEQSDELQLSEIIGAIIVRYNALCADREAIFLSLPTDPHLREQELESIIRLIRNH